MDIQQELIYIDKEIIFDVIDILQFYKDQVDLVYKRENKKIPNFELLSELLEESQRVENLITILKN